MELEIEENDPLGARATTLTVGEVKISTPFRIITNTDQYHAENVEAFTHGEISVDFPHAVFQVKRRFSKEDLRELVKSKGFFESELEKIKGILNKKPKMVKWFEATIGQRVSITDAENNALLSLGLKAGANINTAYDSYDITITQLEQRLKNSAKQAEGEQFCEGFVVKMPVVQSRKAIEDKTTISVKHTDGVDFAYSSPTYAHEKYLTARNILIETEKYFGIADVPKAWSGNARTSIMHVLELYGFDGFSPRTNKRFKMTKRIQPRKRFDKTTLGYLQMPHEHISRYGQNLACFSQCPVDRPYPTLQEQSNDFSPKEQGSVYRVHEAYDSQAEFELNREATLEGKGALAKQFQAHEFALQPLKELFGIDFKTTQTKL